MGSLKISLAYMLALGACRMLCCEAQGTGWQPATATWYGDKNGDGTDGGACGYGGVLNDNAYGSKIAAGSPGLFNGGKGCGVCYNVKCTMNDLCNPTGVTVAITDSCPGGICATGKPHFDLSGTAIGDIAAPGKADALRNVGVVPLLFQRVPCQYPGANIAFHVDPGARNTWFSIVTEYQNGDGDLGAVELMQASSNSWQMMQRSWGANWALNGGPLQAPFSIRLTTLSTGKVLIANNVIPQNWQPNTTYTSTVNY